MSKLTVVRSTAEVRAELLTLPVYGKMVAVIEQCDSVDEIAQMQVQGRMLELYAAQAMNTESERLATGIRVRAEIKAGTLFAELNRTTKIEAAKKGGHAKAGSVPPATIADGSTAYADSLSRTGVNERTAQRWQELSRVPQSIIDRHLEGERDQAKPKPSVNSILRDARSVDGRSKMPEGTLQLWGLLRDWEREDYFSKDPINLFGGMTETMQADVRRILPMLNDWLAILAKELK